MNTLIYAVHGLVSVLLLYLPFLFAGLAQQGETELQEQDYWGMIAFLMPVPLLFLLAGIFISYKKNKPGIGLLITSVPVLLLILVLILAVFF